LRILRRFSTYLILLAAAILVPRLLSGITGGDYYLHLLVMISFWSILGMSLNLVVGFTGLANLAHAGLAGVGAYTAVLLFMFMGLPYWVSFLAAGLIAMLVGVIIGLPTLKLRGVYFAIGTLAITQVLSLIFLNAMPGGSDGVPDVPHLTLWGINFANKVNYAYLFLFFGFVVFIIIRRVVNSRIGRALVAVREGADLAATTGVNIVYYRLLGFMISAFIAGIAGALYAPYMHYTCPADWTIAQLLTLITMLAVGGFGTLWGPIVGAAILTALPEILLPLKDFIFIIYGLILIPTIIFAPRGIMGAVSDLMRRRRAKRVEV